MITKTCDCCHRNLPLSHFGRNVARSDGHQTTCRYCRQRIYLLQTGRLRYPLSRYTSDELRAEIALREPESDVQNFPHER